MHCCSIQWEALKSKKSRAGDRDVSVRIEESAIALQQSQCRICRLCGYLMLLTVEEATPHRLRFDLPTPSHDSSGSYPPPPCARPQTAIYSSTAVKRSRELVSPAKQETVARKKQCFGLRHLSQGPGICERCSSISWGSLTHAYISHHIVVNESIQQLYQSSCRMCRLIGFYLRLRTACAPSFQASSLASSLPGPNVIHDFEFHNRFDRNYGPSERSTFPRIEARNQGTSSKTLKWTTSTESRYPKTLDLRRIKTWLLECENRHGDRCALHSHGQLRQLRVIDCALEQVVDAPPGCQYVALSYVWGKVYNATGATGGNALPQTILDAIKLTRSLHYRYLWVDRYVSLYLISKIAGLTTVVHTSRRSCAQACSDRTDG
jgi:hypothetical protein